MWDFLKLVFNFSNIPLWGIFKYWQSFVHIPVQGKVLKNTKRSFSKYFSVPKKIPHLGWVLGNTLLNKSVSHTKKKSQKRYGEIGYDRVRKDEIGKDRVW